VQQPAHLGELGEDQCPVAHGNNLFQQFDQPRQLAAALGDRRLHRAAVRLVQVLGRVVAGLLELHQHAQHQSAPLDAFARVHFWGSVQTEHISGAHMLDTFAAVR
jgi:hypothetical protein